MTSINDVLEREPLQSLAQYALTFSVDFEKDTFETRKLQKEIEITKRIIHSHFTSPSSASNHLNTVFFVTLTKTIRRLEKAFITHRALRSDFLIFLKALADRIRKEKLAVDKPFERTREFRKLKPISENGRM